MIDEPLGIDNTLQVASVGHRLALGIHWFDAIGPSSQLGNWTSELEAVGSRPCALRFDAHSQARHALRYAGRLGRLLDIAAAEKDATPPASADADQTNLVLRGFGPRSARVDGYSSGNDLRRFVPRRLSLTPQQSAGMPDPGVANIRFAWLWPGCTYPLAANVTALRGRVRRGPSDALATPVAWSRIVVTQAGAGAPDLATETRVGWAHGDDRGEFLVVLGAAAVPGGAALPATLALRVWVLLPPADGFDPADPLASLPVEFAGGDAINDVLRGRQVPAGYLTMTPIDVSFAAGTIFTIDEAQLLFA